MMLDTAAWDHAGSLLAIYDYLLRLLAVANAKKDVAMVHEAMRHLVEIGGAFREAERSAAQPVLPTAAPRPLGDDTVAAEPRRISVQA